MTLSVGGDLGVFTHERSPIAQTVDGCRSGAYIWDWYAASGAFILGDGR